MLTPNVDILDEFLELAKTAMPAKRDELKATQKREIDLWHNWNNNGRKPEHLQPLLDSHKPLIEQEARKWKNRVELPTSAIDAEFKKQWVHAVKTYDPAKGAQLNTWVKKNLQKSSRYVKTYQNVGKISEGQISRIRKFNESKAFLADKHGYEPDTTMLADHLGWSHRRTVQMQTELSRKDLPASMFIHDPSELAAPKELEAIHLLSYDTRLTPEEKNVFEYTHGLNGKPMLQPGEIAKKTKMHPSKVSRIRDKLSKMVHETSQAL